MEKNDGDRMNEGYDDVGILGIRNEMKISWMNEC